MFNLELRYDELETLHSTIGDDLHQKQEQNKQRPHSWSWEVVNNLQSVLDKISEHLDERYTPLE